MKAVFILLFVFCYAECRKVVPLDKNANLAFIHMEGGGGSRPNGQPAAPTNNKLSPVQTPTPASVNKQPVTPQVTTPKVTVTTKQSLPVVTPTQRPTLPTLVTPKSVNPPVVSNPITTPGPGSVKNLINFYDSQGRASVIRPYSYSQAVKQG